MIWRNSSVFAIIHWRRSKLQHLYYTATGTAMSLFSHSELVASNVPRAKFVIDEGGDHFFFITHREKIIPMLQEFLEHSTQSEIPI